MQPLRSLEDPDPVQRYALRRKRVRDYILAAAVLLLLLVGYFGVYR